MKTLVLVVLTFVSIIGLRAQSLETVEGDSVPWEIRKQSFIYNSARLFNDPMVAKMALYNLMSETPGNPAVYDSLALIYMQFNQYASSALVSQQSLQINPENQFAMEMAASSFDNLGAKDRALPYYESLYLASNDLNVLYKIAFVQMEMQRFSEGLTSVDIIMQSAGAKESFIAFPTQEGTRQDVPLDVAAHRIKAMIEEGRGNTDLAKELYLKTLEMYPGFQMVQAQLQELVKEDKQ